MIPCLILKIANNICSLAGADSTRFPIALAGADSTRFAIALAGADSTRFARLPTLRFGLTQSLSLNKQSLFNGIVKFRQLTKASFRPCLYLTILQLR
jgi:hypothetical protein